MLEVDKKKLERELLEKATSRTVKTVTKKYKYQDTNGGRQKVLVEENVKETFIPGDRAILLALSKKEGLIIDYGDKLKESKFIQEVDSENYNGLGEYM